MADRSGAADAERLAVWVSRWERAREAALRINKGAGKESDGRVAVGPPASETELAAVESATGNPIPRTLRRLFGLARSVTAWWHLDEIDPPQPFGDLFSGECDWSLDLVAGRLEDYRGWVAEVFPDPNDRYDRVWHDKYPLLDVPNGDVVALDADERVVYLSHDDGEGHGLILGQNVFEFLDEWTVLGCPGPEDWQWLPFVRGEPAGGLDADGVNGRAWRSWFGLP